jgi:hypothetical protein
MADDPRAIRGIDWKTAFPFTLIFRSFRVAVHPSKLILALAALLLIYWGGRAMDGLTPASASAVPDELGLYGLSWTAPNPAEQFRVARQQAWDATQAAYKARLTETGKPNATLRDVAWHIEQRRNQDVKAAEERYETVRKSNAPQTEKDNAKVERDREVANLYLRAAEEYDEAKASQGVGLFETFYEYELGALNMIVRGVRSWTWLSPGGVLDGLREFFVVAPSWAVQRHWLFFSIFFLYFLVIWSVFGGAIARIAAVHVARDEKISIRQALRFSTAKFLSFFSAPLIPIVIILAVGLVVAVAGAITNVPWIGPIIVGLFFFLALAAGFVMALVLIGLVGGFNLMYPTIAVEGSDSFDAISRSFSYLYARPWRLVFYTAIAIAYGAITYMFVRYFIQIMLTLTHRFAGMFVYYHAENHAFLWNMIWPSPSAVGRLAYPVQTFSLNSGEALGAYLIAMWVYLVVFMLGAYVISLYFSANTVVYYLMRNEVDATELDDVYLEQSPEDLVDGGGPTPIGAGDAASANAPTIVTPTTPVTTTASTSETGQPESPIGTSAPAEPPST